MTTRHERRAMRSRRLEAAAIGTAVLLTCALCQLAPDEEAAVTEGTERGAGTRLNGTDPPGPVTIVTESAPAAEASPTRR